MREENELMDPVSATALWTAAARARESARADRLFDDPLGEILAGPEGFELLDSMEARVTDGGTSLGMVVRTRFFDDAIGRLVDGRQISQVVILAAGMDARAFRLSWPPGVRLYELDRPEVLEVKESRLRTVDARASCDRVTVGVDLVGEWAPLLLAAGFEADRPSLWLVEGLLFYLDRDGVQRLLGQLGALAGAHSILLTDLVGTSFLTHPWTQARLNVMAELDMPFRFGTDDPESLLREHGWSATATRYGEEGANFDRWPDAVASQDDPDLPRSYLITARRAARTP